MAAMMTLFSLAGSANASVTMNVRADSPFVDVPADYDFREAIGFLKEKKIVQGYPDQTYKPEASISRAEFVKIALRLSGRGTGTGTAPSALGTGTESGKAYAFLDVHQDDWFYSDVMTAVKLGIVEGVKAGAGSAPPAAPAELGTGTAPAAAGVAYAFLPNAKITRVQALKIAFKALQYEPKVGFASDIAPSDVPTGAWFYKHVMSARRLNILTDSDDGLFYPNQEITRGMAAEILFRVNLVKNQGGKAVDITRGWVAVEKVVAGGGGFDDVTFRVPRTWVAFKDGSRVTVIKKDPGMSLDYELVTPLSAKVVVKTSKLDESAGESAEVYFTKIKMMSASAYNNVKFSSITVMGYPALDIMAPDQGLENWYIWTGNRGLVAVYGQYGLGSLSLKLHESIRGIVRTLAVKEVGTGVGPRVVDEKLISEIQGKVLVEKVGKATLDSLGDGLIIETDEIGVGTGPVDYYFSEKIQLTLKYERTSDTILAVRTGKTTAF